MRRLLAFAALCCVATAVAAEGPPAAWVDAGRGVPVAAEGRILPLDTWARVVADRLAGRPDDPAALERFLTLLAFPERLDDEPMLLAEPVALEGTGVTASGLVSPRTLAPVMLLIDEWAQQYADDTTPMGRERLRLARSLQLYRGLAATLVLDSPWAATSPFAALDLGKGNLNPLQALSGGTDRDRLALLLYWQAKSVDGAWDEASAALREFAGDRAALEVFHNHVPWNLLMAALAALGAGVLIARPWWRWVPVLVASPWAIMTLWLVVRVTITGRPPVTDLPSSFLLVSWFAMGGATALAFRADGRVPAAWALAAGGLLPLLAGAFETGADPFSPLQAVLNTNVWLGTHVTAIVAGYAGALGAGLMGHAYLWTAGARNGGRGLEVLWKALQWCLLAALALTLTGTLLGGVWADQSWGRFWGWDPKENGALMLILWLALVLHLKPAGFAAEAGTAVAAALTVPVLLFSWLGVNVLGQGFHSYGAAQGKALLFVGLVAADVAVVSLLNLRRSLR